MTVFKSFSDHRLLKDNPTFALYWFEDSWVLAGPEGLQRLDRVKLTYDNLGGPYAEFARVNGVMPIALDDALTLKKECDSKLVPFSMDSGLSRVLQPRMNPPLTLSLFESAVRDLIPPGQACVFLFWNETCFSSCRGAESWRWQAFSSIAEAIEAASVVDSPEFLKAIALKMGGKIFSFLSPILDETEWFYSEEESDLQNRINQVLGNRN